MSTEQGVANSVVRGTRRPKRPQAQHFYSSVCPICEEEVSSNMMAYNVSDATFGNTASMRR